MNFFPRGRNTRVLVMSALLIFSAAATYWCHHVIHVEVVFTHLFYLPVTLAGLWWGRTGTVVPGFLGLMLIISHSLSPLPGSPINDIMRVAIFILVGLTVGWLSDLHNIIEKRLIDLNNTKNKFFSIISHDLRSPFQTLIYLSEQLCANTKLFPEDKVGGYAQRLCVTSKRLFSLVEDLLQWSQIETGKIDHQPEMTNMKGMIEDVAALYSDYAARKTIQITTRVPEGLTAWVDKSQIRCILRNLISNAVKFSHRGSEVLVDASSDNDTVNVSVIDTGVGIKPEVQEKIFRIDIFHTTAGTDNEKGSGLGLVLTRELVEMNGGSLSMQSSPDHGSTFTFTLPLKALNPHISHLSIAR